MDTQLDTLSGLISQNAASDRTWTQPTEFNFALESDRQEATRRLESGSITKTHDAMNEISDDLFELRSPDQKENLVAREEFVRAMGARGIEYGRWFHFDWDGSLVRYPDVQDLRDLRTFRNKNVITDEEQDTLYGSTIAVAGLSVGSSVVDSLTMGGIGGTQILADFDTLSPSNLNRINATFSQVGMNKIDIAAQKISKTDPYINQIHMRNGLDTAAFETLAELKPDIIYDEIDDLSVKAMIRKFAARNKIPVIMATDVGDTSIIDIERHDLGTVKPFNGRLSESQVDDLAAGTMPDAQKRRMTPKLVGIKNASPRLLQSAMEMNKTLGGLPQLGTTATMGGSLAAVAGREILIGRKLDSGRYVSSMKESLSLQSQATAYETVQILRKFIANNRAQ